jgi:hypothetical protein
MNKNGLNNSLTIMLTLGKWEGFMFKASKIGFHIIIGFISFAIYRVRRRWRKCSVICPISILNLKRR